MARIFIILPILFFALRLQANSCCGQSPASFPVLSLDQKLSVTTGLTYLQSVGRVYEDPRQFYIWQDKKREVRTLLLNMASVVSEGHQVFLNANLQQGIYRDSFETGQATHISDILLGYTYELVSEYQFSWWKPVVYITALVNLPTGHSIYDQNSLSEGAGVSGHGQWGSGLGLSFRKVYFPLTLTLQARSIRLLGQNFSGTKVSGFYDSSVALLANYASPWWSLQFNTGLTFNHLSGRRLQPINEVSGESRNFTVLVGLQRAINEDWVGGINYSDQTLYGSAKNTLLNRSLSLTFNYNYF